jgi:hypothetical protein
MRTNAGKTRQIDRSVTKALKQFRRAGRADTLEITELIISRQHFIGASLRARIQSGQFDE